MKKCRVVEKERSHRRFRKTTFTYLGCFFLRLGMVAASQRHPWARRGRQSRSQRIGSSLHPISSNLFGVRDPRTTTSRHSHFGLEALRASVEILWCWSGSSPKCIPHVVACASKWVPRLPRPSFRTPVSHEIVLSVAVFAFHRLLRLAEARQLRWCDVEIVDRSVNTLRKSLWYRPHQRTQKAQDDRFMLCNSTYFLSVLESVNWSIP